MAKTARKLVLFSEEMNEALGVFSQQKNISMQEIIRIATAEYIGYDLSLERKNKVETRGRPKLYKNKEERKLAAKRRRDEQRALVELVMSDARRQEREQAARAIESSLARRGVI